MDVTVYKKRLYVSLFLPALFILCAGTGGCSRAKQHLHSERIAVLNTLLESYSDDEDSVAVFEQSMESLSFYLPKEKLTAHYFTRGKDSVAIPQEDIDAWRSQWEHYRPVAWKEWGWDTLYLISREEFPDYYDYSVPPPGYELPAVMVDILYFSIPFIGMKYSMVFRNYQSGKHTVVVSLIILEKKNEKWVFHSSKGLLTS